jgi:seryl-tRNA synthetase
MIDIRLVRDDAARVQAALGRRGIDAAEVEGLAELDRQVRAAARRRDDLRAEVKALSRQVAEARRAGDDARAAELTGASRAVGEQQAAADLDRCLNQFIEIACICKVSSIV